jgi:hypothetical protein
MVSVATLALMKDDRLRLALDVDHRHVPTLAVQPVKVTPAGAESLKTTLFASYGPLLISVTVYVSGSPTSIPVAGQYGLVDETDFVTARSALLWLVK